ncbi:Endo-beta-N-acetylglucosaminidase F2 precursor [Candidatus Ornithobacterium hominis]|uniref:Endo-beta-N-acetylglucosaminidase F2 n=1 Tax=Candidatus Ornithobacterium hominis TaxID=2497989 RepID=A0A383TV09_9FLAO|nr:glycoside hydrolase family 18 [Candidatus Ornithobacterium hominis]MCT7903844.1 glycoside hydrolase family 18 [Candidatus Ornithobacterium hominis]SZD71187.1 Endo-beta-N-acetylglucosaminidase F2 precursor [Candidatus Ornithobacterium hominis]
MKTKYLILFILPFLFFSCSDWTETEKIDIEKEQPAILAQLRARDMKKWAEERNLQKQEDEDTKAYNERIAKMYDKYWENIRAYKKSNHPIVYGWFGGWSATEGIPKTQLASLPDSVDVVAIWGGTTPFEEGSAKWADLKYAQEVKGIRVVLCWQTGTAGLGLPGTVEGFNERHKDKNNLEKAKQYAIELTDFIKKHNFNGYDIDWEPHVGNHRGCGNLYFDCENESGEGTNSAAPAKIFIEEMAKNFGPKQTTDYNPRGTGTLFMFDGELDDMARRFPEHGEYFDYFVEQNYNRVSEQYSNYMPMIKDYDKSKHLFSDEFEKAGAKGGVCHQVNGLSCAEQKAHFVKRNGYGGWAAYHIELEQEANYKYTRKVIRILNPRDIYNNFLP